MTKSLAPEICRNSVSSRFSCFARRDYMSIQVAVKNLTGIAPRELVQPDCEMGIAGADGSVEHEILATFHEDECLDLRPQSAGMRRAGSSECRNTMTTKGGSWRTSSMASSAKGRPTCRPPAAPDI